MEVAVGIEPTNKSFADSGLTTWLRHLKKMERETRFELATSTLARWSSTTELLPHCFDNLCRRNSERTSKAYIV